MSYGPLSGAVGVRTRVVVHRLFEVSGLLADILRRLDIDRILFGGSLGHIAGKIVHQPRERGMRAGASDGEKFVELFPVLLILRRALLRRRNVIVAHASNSFESST